MAKASLNALLRDEEVMNEIAGLASNSAPGFESQSIPDQSFMDYLLSNREFPAEVLGGNLEAIIRLTGRPSLLVKNNSFDLSNLEAVNKRLTKHRAAIEKAIPSVGRLDIINHATYKQIGTAWMIDEDIMITNRHVAEVFARRMDGKFFIGHNPFGVKYKTQIDFIREYDNPEEKIIPILDIIFMEKNDDISPDLALIRVERSPFLPDPIVLSNRKLGLDDNTDIAVIGYPAWDGNRNNAFVMEEYFKGIYDVKRMAPGRVSSVHPRGHIFTHDCTTLGGNSGSVVLSMSEGKAIGLHFSGVFRENNFAVASTTILRHMANIGIKVSMPDLVGSGIASTGGPPVEVAPSANQLQGREGYDPLFLGEDFEVPHPKMSAEIANQVVEVGGNGGDLLHYTHYSLKMHKQRRMAIYTAVNIDGTQLFGVPRNSDVWYFDPRVDEKFQAGRELYRQTNLHRGHLVRRLDPAWGENRQTAKAAVEDTFYYTNSTPQHERFNPRSWLDLEDYILDNANAENLKVSVFTGPIFSETDKVFRGYKIPETYWKVAFLVNGRTAQLSAAGYIVSQKDFMNDLEFVYGEFQTYQVPIKMIQEKTGLDFGIPSGTDVFGNNESTYGIKLIKRASDMVF